MVDEESLIPMGQFRWLVKEVLKLEPALRSLEITVIDCQ